MKKLLVLAYYFPPLGGTGVVRTLKFVKYLPALGWSPTVVAPDPRWLRYPKDATLIGEIPPEVTAVRTPSLDPNWLYKGLYGLRLNRAVRWLNTDVFRPDPMIGWLPFAKRAIERLMEREQFDAVYTSSPPHSVQLLGRWAKERFGLPWVADFRDPWSFAPLSPHALGSPEQRGLAELERGVVHAADRLIANTPLNRDEWIANFGLSPSKIVWIPNGYDPAELDPAVARLSPQPVTDVFTLLWVGRFYGEHNPSRLFRALAECRERCPKLRLKIVGGLHRQFEAEAAALGIADRLDVLPFVAHDEALAEMNGATALLAMLADPRWRNYVPGKLCEYLPRNRFVVGILPTDGCAADLIRETRVGWVVAPDEAAIAAALVDLYAAWEAAGGRLPVEPDWDAVARYDRRRLTAQLAEVLTDVSRA